MTQPIRSPHASPRNRLKPHDDPFFKLPVTPPRSSSASSYASPELDVATLDDQQEDSLLTRVIVAPFLFISFLVSLFIVDRNHRLYRASSHPSNIPPSNSLWTRISSAWNPEPYQDPANSTWNVRQDQGWFVRKKHRKVTKLQLDQALEMRGRVMIAIVGIVVVSFLLGAWGIKWTISTLGRYLYR
ncbi:hypothetical protein M501DRAFT_38574 [Patellaria atrata CBS 101060]|uniref:Uncharacterized protein n=1 Tax=Patellaria atrata CBS 101060 TaxID=1346257 RepID=A0A9P4SHA9_9PEZI|nr:hypothetical protein M501DRAFT_38574 [Patellaria atrata CBS 101060]